MRDPYEYSTTTDMGMTAKGTIVPASFEGDPSIPNGTRSIATYVDGLKIIYKGADGKEFDVTDCFTDFYLESVENQMLSEEGYDYGE